MAEPYIRAIVHCTYFSLLMLQAPAFLFFCTKVMATEATTVASAFSDKNTKH